MRPSYWSKELTTYLIELVRDNEDLWQRNSSQPKKAQAWNKVIREINAIDPNLSEIDIKTRYKNVKHQYFTCLRKYERTGVQVNSWCYDMLKFLPNPLKLTAGIKWPKEAVAKLAELLEPNACLWTKTNANFYNMEVKEKAAKRIAKELKSVFPKITLNLVQSKICCLRNNFKNYKKTQGKSMYQHRPWWYEHYSFLEAIIEEGNETRDGDCMDTEITDEDDFDGDETAKKMFRNFEDDNNNKNYEDTEDTNDYDARDKKDKTEEDHISDNSNLNVMFESDSEETVCNFNTSSCRICLVKNGYFNLEDSIAVNAPSFQECYQRFFQLNCNVKFKNAPTKICYNCGLQLQSTFELAKKAMNSYEILKSYVLTKSNNCKYSNDTIKHKEVEVVFIERSHDDIIDYSFNDKDEDSLLLSPNNATKCSSIKIEIEKLPKNSRENNDKELGDKRVDDDGVVTDDDNVVNDDDNVVNDDDDNLVNDDGIVNNDDNVVNDDDDVNVNDDDDVNYNDVTDAEDVNDDADDNVNVSIQIDRTDMEKYELAEEKTKSKELEKKDIPKKKRKTTFSENLCHICSKTFANPYSLRKHLETHNENRERKYECDICGSKSLSVAALKIHKNNHNPNRKRYPCEFCDKTFTSTGELNIHKRQHTGEMLQCPICPKTFCRKFELTAHIDIHNGNAKYECEYCGKKFFRGSHYNEHKLRLHENFKMTCNHCKRSFNSQKCYKNHLYTHTGYPYECTMCGAGRPTRDKCRYHIKHSHKLTGKEEIESVIKEIPSKILKLPRRQYYRINTQPSIPATSAILDEFKRN